MNNKTIICIMAVILIIAIAVGLITRFSYVDDLSQMEYMDNDEKRTELIAELNGVYIDDKIDSIEDLVETADVIVKVTVSPDYDRVYNTDMTISYVDIIDIYKGDIEGKTASVIEPIFYFADGDYIASINGYSWMKEEEEYILFLTKLKDAHLGNDEYIYIPTTARYSKYSINSPDDLTKSILGYSKYISLRDEVLNYNY